MLTASKSPETFSSAGGAVSILDMPAEMNEYFGSMISMDDPRHARLRKIVSGTFTPKMLNRVLDDVAATARDVVAAAKGKGVVDFVAEVSSPFPLIVVCDLMGIPDSERAMVLEQSNIILSGGDPEFIPDGTDPVTAFLGAGSTLVELMNGLADERRARPTDDLTSALVNTAVDGEQLSGDELASFFILLSVAGHETTRTGISHAVTLLGQNPDQRAIWQADVEGVTGTAVEEVVRIASPVIWMRRTAHPRRRALRHAAEARATRSSSTTARPTATRPCSTTPTASTCCRDPNPHVGFGGPGPHFCLGAHLARREIALLIGELFRQIPDWQLAGEPEQLRSSFVNGIKHLPVDVGS